MNNSLITVEISTKNRFDILHLALMSIAMQTYPPAKFILFDDSDEDKRVDLRQITIYKNIFKLFEKETFYGKYDLLNKEVKRLII